MYVVVYLIDVKKNVIVPEKHINGLDEESLKNVGANHNFTYQIFWSENATNDEGVPNGEYQPNFNLPKSMIFPPDVPDACYTGRIKNFFRK